MNQHRTSPESPSATPFTPVPRRRKRHDGWTPERQTEFIQALAECACIDEACARVGVSRSAAYAFRARADARNRRRCRFAERLPGMTPFRVPRRRPRTTL